MGWGKDNHPVGFDRWKLMMDFLFEKDFEGMDTVELRYIDAISIRLMNHKRLNSNQDTFLSKVFKRSGGKI